MKLELISDWFDLGLRQGRHRQISIIVIQVGKPERFFREHQQRSCVYALPAEGSDEPRSTPSRSPGTSSLWMVTLKAHLTRWLETEYALQWGETSKRLLKGILGTQPRRGTSSRSSGGSGGRS